MHTHREAIAWGAAAIERYQLMAPGEQSQHLLLTLFKLGLHDPHEAQRLRGLGLEPVQVHDDPMSSSV